MTKQKLDDHRMTLLRGLPKIDEIILSLEKKEAFAGTPKYVVKSICRSVVEELRQEILNTKMDAKGMRLPTAGEVVDKVMQIIDGLHQYRLRKVVNATGVILHTNLGRAPLCADALQRLMEIAGGYSNLEYDLVKGERGLRYDHVQKILCELSGAEDALVVNNNAAAVLLALNTLAEGKQVIVSRGELVEIGGEFRIPEVMEKSGACLYEVGTTNRTRLKDYEKAIGPETALILKVHTSNFRIIGFTEDTDLASLVALGKNCGIPVMYDLGSGCFAELDRYGLEREPTVRDMLATGAGSGGCHGPGAGWGRGRPAGPAGRDTASNLEADSALRRRLPDPGPGQVHGHPDRPAGLQVVAPGALEHRGQPMLEGAHARSAGSRRPGSRRPPGPTGGPGRSSPCPSLAGEGGDPAPWRPAPRGYRRPGEWSPACPSKAPGCRPRCWTSPGALAPWWRRGQAGTGQRSPAGWGRRGRGAPAAGHGQNCGSSSPARRTEAPPYLTESRRSRRSPAASRSGRGLIRCTPCRCQPARRRQSRPSGCAPNGGAWRWRPRRPGWSCRSRGGPRVAAAR